MERVVVWVAGDGRTGGRALYVGEWCGTPQEAYQALLSSPDRYHLWGLNQILLEDSSGRRTHLRSVCYDRNH